MQCEGESRKEAGDCGSRMFQVWGEGAQVQSVPSLERRKEVVSSKRGGTCGHATKGTAKEVEEEFSICPTTKGARALWRGHSR